MEKGRKSITNKCVKIKIDKEGKEVKELPKTEPDHYGLLWEILSGIDEGLCNSFMKFQNQEGFFYGEMSEGKMNGLGVFFFFNKSNKFCYIGDFENNKRCGNGKLMYTNPDAYYEGGFKNDEFSGYGKGKIMYSERNYYEGDLLDGKKHGYGINSINSSKFEGNWDND